MEYQAMKAGVFERVLTRRYGKPITSILDGMAARVWNPGDDHYEAVLYLGMKWQGLLEARFHSLKALYGNSCGGYLMKNTLKAAILLPKQIYGVWNIDALRALPAVHHAVLMDPAIDYFMDEHNVFYYGVKAGQLYVFDNAFDELDALGPVEQAIETRMDEWDATYEEPPNDEPSP
jgi:hypothetical protein